MSNVLLFSIGLNGYHRVYDRCIASQRDYAQRHGYDYAIVDRCPTQAAGEESAWLKIPLMLAALERGFDWVFFIDADCEIRKRTPAIESLETPGKALFLANGFSGRVNSGVMIARNAEVTRRVFATILDNAQETVPEADRALWENGHVIHYTKGADFLQILDRRWNNNADVDLDDYVRHYSAGGPMRPLYQPSFAGRLAAVSIRWRKRTQRWKDGAQRRIWPGAQPASSHPLNDRLAPIVSFCRTHWPVFGSAHS